MFAVASGVEGYSNDALAYTGGEPIALALVGVALIALPLALRRFWKHQG